MKVRDIGSAKKVVFNEVMTFDEAGKLEGEFIKESFMKKLAKKNGTKHWLIDFDCDGYLKKDGKEILVFVYRKHAVSEENALQGLDNLKRVAMKKKINRGSFAGKLDMTRMPSYVGEFYKPTKFRTRYYSSVSGKLGNQYISNFSPSNIVGYYDKADRNLLGKGSDIRVTAFIRDYPEKWNNAMPYFNELHTIYRDLYKALPEPNPYNAQLRNAKLSPNAIIGDTVFSTGTINYSCQSAMHLDKGNMEGGIAVLSVIADPFNENSYTGAYLAVPQIGLCIDNNHRDVLICDNKNLWHGNTEFKPIKDKVYPVNMNTPSKMPSQQDIDNDWYFNRFICVMYLRDSIVGHYDHRDKKNDVDTLGISEEIN
tara:strand:- start:781 stop:1884 length:1104 start_codon:yes stop_codon:yes gene_type:complete